MNPKHYIACDLGAESGRVMVGTLEEGKLQIEEVHRFSNGPARIMGTYRWDTLRIFEELKKGLRKVAERGNRAEEFECGLVGGGLCADAGDGAATVAFLIITGTPRTDRTYEAALRKATAAERIFEETGIQFMSINTLYQFLADLEERPELLAVADRFLLIGDYFNYLFSGRGVAEESLASTTQIYDPRKRAWSRDLIGYVWLQ